MISFDKEQKFIVTGASSGIGEEIALSLNKLGASVIGIGRDRGRLLKMQSKCEYPENVYIEIKDLAVNIDELPNYVKSLKEKYGKFQGLVYCAGASLIQPLKALDISDMQKNFEVNYFAPIFFTKGFADKRNNNGKNSSIIFISSASSMLSDKGHIIYAGSKAALTASVKSIARELASSEIRVNCLSPSDIQTPMTKNKINNDEYKYPFGYGEVSDVANFAVFLLSDSAKWITAQNYVIDCGSF